MRMLRTKNTTLMSLLAMAGLAAAMAVACGAASSKDAGADAKAKKDDAPLAPISYDPRISLSPLVEKVGPAVVNISTSQVVRRPMSPFGGMDPFEFFFGPRGPQGMPGPEMDRKARSLGSGFIIDKSGVVVTNNHVVAGADEIEVQLSDKRKFKGKVIGTDPRTDVAVLRLEGAKNLPTVMLGDSDALKVGDQVVAIGNPFGLDHTVTAGIVSAKERVIGAGPYDQFIQTDASINPGNSGGPLFNLRGEVVGINTAIAPQGQGIGFAIPSNQARHVSDSLSRDGKVVRGYLGLLLQPLDEQLGSAMGVKNGQGALVAEVTSGSPAEAAGVQAGDIVVEVAGKAVKDSRSLQNAVAGLKPGSKVKLKVIRNKDAKNLDVTIGEMPSEPGEATSGKKAKADARLGFGVSALSGELRQRLGLPPSAQGVVVDGVDESAPASEVLRPGDIITEVNRKSVRSVEDFKAATTSLKKGDDMLLRLNRQGQWLYAVIRL
ncbi:MAG: DegQ family serine endoprotease [Myxococcota bacterium]|nr:DegQ family serine endoprotease [Myxococcota bacterium]